MASNKIKAIPKKTMVQNITDKITIPLNLIISTLKKDDNIEKYLTQDEINHILYMISESKLPPVINNSEEIIDSVKNIIKLYLENKNQILTIGSSVITKYITDKIKFIITKYKFHQFRKLKIKQQKKAANVKRLHRK